MARNASTRPGYTLLEIVIVCAIVVMILAMALPTYRGMSGSYKLQGAVDSVRGAWAMARARAIEEGRPYRFAVEPNSSYYRVAPDAADYWSGSPPAQDPEGQGMILEKALPSGVQFSLNDEQMPTQALQTPLTVDRENALPPNISPDAWTPVAVFLPQGNARENVRITFQVRGVRPVVLNLRALTGTVTVQTLTQTP